MKRVDDNQKEIVDALRQRGCSVLSLAPMGKGCPDIAVGRQGFTFFLEIKNGKKPPSGQKLTGYETAFMITWRGHYAIVNSVAQALEAVGLTG